MAGEKQPVGVGYLNELETIVHKKCKAKTEEELTDLRLIGEAFDMVSANLVQKLGRDFEECLKRPGMDADAAYEETAISRLFTAKAHTYGYLFHRFHDAVERAPSHLSQVLTNLCSLYGLYTIQENAGSFLQYGYFTAPQMDMIRSRVLHLCRILRQDAITLTDAFNLPDFLLNSPFGRHDGDVYTNYFNHVKARNPPVHPPEYFQRIIYPLIHRQPLDESEPEEEGDGEDEGEK